MCREPLVDVINGFIHAELDRRPGGGLPCQLVWLGSSYSQVAIRSCVVLEQRCCRVADAFGEVVCK